MLDDMDEIDGERMIESWLMMVGCFMNWMFNDCWLMTTGEWMVNDQQDSD